MATANGSAPKVARRRGSDSVKWDEPNLSANALEAEQASRTRIDEPKTPFHYLEEDGEAPQAFPPPARAARPAQEQAPGYHERQLQAGMHDLSAITAAALAKREEPDPEPLRELFRRFGFTRLLDSLQSDSGDEPAQPSKG